MPLHDREALMRNLDHLKLVHILSNQVTTSNGQEWNDRRHSATSQGSSPSLGVEAAPDGVQVFPMATPESDEPKISELHAAGTTQDSGDIVVDPSLMPSLHQSPPGRPNQEVSIPTIDDSSWPMVNVTTDVSVCKPPFLGVDYLGDFLSLDTDEFALAEETPSYPPPPVETKVKPESTEALIDQLSDRIGSLQIGPGGQVRYYGPTSNFNLVQMPAPDNLNVHRTVRNNGQEYLERLGLDKEVPVELENHLTNLYFSWQNPVSQIVKRTMFEEARASWCDKKQDTPYYSEALQNAM